MYKHILKPILFRFNPETAHNMIMSSLTFLRHIPFAGSITRSIFKKETPTLAREVFGINFPFGKYNGRFPKAEKKSVEQVKD